MGQGGPGGHGDDNGGRLGAQCIARGPVLELDEATAADQIPAERESERAGHEGDDGHGHLAERAEHVGEPGHDSVDGDGRGDQGDDAEGGHERIGAYVYLDAPRVVEYGHGMTSLAGVMPRRPGGPYSRPGRRCSHDTRGTNGKHGTNGAHETECGCATLEVMSELYVTTGAAARSLGLGLTTLRDWAARGLVTPAYTTPGGHLRWDLDSLRAELDLPAAHSGAPGDVEPQPVVAAVVLSELGVLITRRRDGRPPYGFVSGEIEPGESPADAAVREVKEETGLIVRPLRVLGRRVHPATGRTMIYMSAAPVQGTGVHVGDEAELLEVCWVTPAAAAELLPGMFGPALAYILGERGRGAKSA